MKELPWCAPKSSPSRKAGLVNQKTNENINSDNYNSKVNFPQPIEQFGIVAAMSHNRVIGLQGKIPWPRCAEDRQNFKNLTKDGIIIVGRSTYEEQPHQKHICHTSDCIVVSTTLTDEQLASSNVGAPETRLKIAKSLPEALNMAKQISENNVVKSSSQSRESHCWVAGGERLYEEALRHKSAKEVHLTTMHLEVDVDRARTEAQNEQIEFAMFPSKHRWDRNFQEVSRVEGGGPLEGNQDSPYFTYITYVRKEV